MTQRELDTLVEGLVDVLKKSLAPLKKRLADLEARPQIAYQGAYEDGKAYAAGAFVSRSGGLWLAMTETCGQPGSDNSGWRLVCKEGRAV